ncbi:3-deoxy-D-manno-octulosonic acid transferase [Neptunomonas marina]|uniref:3-deoxy-D-manno-octulosonic acid transferase n=1 Tax=Neptunomonas marina TaxID=1815562 RepID=A0A437Q8J6_9GAMM|nr:3-deoxy-D-manno-octulosonic acid transferase [Neptunomonas marina]
MGACVQLFVRFCHELRWFAYRALVTAKRFVYGKGITWTPSVLRQTEANSDQPYVWLFVSTIGELNACEGFIKHLSESYNLVFLTDRIFYASSFLDRYPEAAVMEINDTADFRQPLVEMPPQYLVVCEMPCLPSDAPCRFSYETLYRIKRGSHVPIYLVNGWVYQYEPSCRQDALQSRWFEQDYIGLFDQFLVQTDEVKEYLLDKGASHGKVEVVGNMKFDNMSAEAPYLPCQISRSLLKSYGSTEKPVVVAGCVTDIWEYEIVVDAMSQFLTSHPDALFIIAPRHPEKPEQLEALMAQLAKASFRATKKSELSHGDCLSQVLVLDTIGELRAYYAVADICYVGVDHNVLEPLAFGKPVAVFSNWNTTYPSYPVFEVLSEQGLLLVSHSSDDISQHWMHHFGDSVEDVKLSLARLTGATERTLERLSL